MPSNSGSFELGNIGASPGAVSTSAADEKAPAPLESTWVNFAKLCDDANDLMKKQSGDKIDNLSKAISLFSQAETMAWELDTWGIDLSSMPYGHYRTDSQDGLDRAQNALGVEYLLGINITRDIHKAAEFLKPFICRSNQYNENEAARKSVFLQALPGIFKDKENADKFVDACYATDDDVCHQMLATCKFAEPAKQHTAKQGTAVLPHKRIYPSLHFLKSPYPPSLSRAAALLINMKDGDVASAAGPAAPAAVSPKPAPQ